MGRRRWMGSQEILQSIVWDGIGFSILTGRSFSTGLVG
jgi:hypothetical protein